MSVWTSPRMREDGAVARAGDLEVASSSRAWFIAIRFSRRSSIHFTGRLTWRAANGIRKSSGIELAARAVAAADVVLDHLDLLDRQADLRRQDAAVEERHLGGAGDRELALGLVPLGHDAARLHGEAVVAAGAQPLAADVGRVGEGRVGVALARLEHQRAVGAGLLEQQALVLRRRLSSRRPPAARRSRPRSRPARPRRWRRCRPAPRRSARRRSAPCRGRSPAARTA